MMIRSVPPVLSMLAIFAVAGPLAGCSQQSRDAGAEAANSAARDARSDTGRAIDVINGAAADLTTRAADALDVVGDHATNAAGDAGRTADHAAKATGQALHNGAAAIRH